MDNALIHEIKWRSYYTLKKWQQRLSNSSNLSTLVNPYVYFDEMKRTQGMKKQELDRQTLNKLRLIVNHAYSQVPYYKHLYEPLKKQTLNLSTLSDFQKLPVVTKEDLRAAGDMRLAENSKKSRLIEYHTSGSTGSPFSVYLDHRYLRIRWASRWLFNSFFGARPQTRYFLIPHDFQVSQRRPQIRSFRERVRMTLQLVNIHSRYVVSYQELNEDNLPKLINRLVKFKPRYGVASPSQLNLLCDLLSEKSVDFVELQAMLSQAETLVDNEKTRFEDVLGCPLYNRFASIEFSTMAGECVNHEGMHVNPHRLFIEILDDNNEPCSIGETGNIVVTDFYNMSMPFIRYKIGDVASFESSCGCGRSSPLLGKFVGRESELALDKDGRKVPVLYLFSSKDLSRHVRFFYFKQTKPGEVTMYIVPEPDWDETLVKTKMIERGKNNRIVFNFKIVNQVSQDLFRKRQLMIR